MTENQNEQNPPKETLMTDEIQSGVSTGEISINEDGSGLSRIHDEATNESESDQPAIKVPVRENATNVTQSDEIFSALPENNKEVVGLHLPSERSDIIEEFLLKFPNVDLANSPGGEEWLNSLQTAKYTTPANNWFTRTVDRPNSDFRQNVMSEKGPLAAGGLRFSDNLGQKLSGEKAVLRIRALTGLGSVINVPLWHSGFWVTLKAPTDSAMLELNRRLTEEKIQLGRSTYGLAFANNSVFYVGWLVDFALAHVYDSSIKTDQNTNIRGLISALDIPLLIWGLACSIWPNGFPYSRSVLNTALGENKVIREKINLGKILWVDNRTLTPWQISHMAQRHGSNMTLESIQRYKDEFTIGKGRRVDLTPIISMNLRVPTIDQYLESGQKWVNNIVSMVDRAFGLQQDETTRDAYILDQGRATNMRQFAHVVESIEAGGDLIDDLETLEPAIDALSSNDDIKDTYFKAIKEFIEDSTMAVIAIPVTENEERVTLPRFPHLLPIDTLAIFFIQLVLKATQIQNRS